MKKKRTNKFISKLRIWRFEIVNFIKKAFKSTGHFIIKIFSMMQLPVIVLFTLIVIGLIVVFLMFPQWASIGEMRIQPIINKLELFGVLLTAVSLLAAAITIILAIQKPKLRVVFYSDHGTPLDCRKGEVELGIDKDGKIGYQGCVPTKWNMNLINVGRKTAEKVKIKFSFDDIYFDMKLVEEGYDLEGFMYGCGIFSSLSFEVTSLLRQGEQIVIPDLPFYLSSCDEESLREKGYTYLKIYIYSGNHEPTVMKYKVAIKDYDLPSYNYSSGEDDSMLYWEYRRNFWNWYRSNNGDLDDSVEQHCCEKLEPYCMPVYPNVEESKYLYRYYKDKEINEMLFWGRIYYRATGMQLQEIEAILQTELLKISACEIKKKEGKMSII